jgi:glycosyltransferase involved in cell wall biosynthesis
MKIFIGEVSVGPKVSIIIPTYKRTNMFLRRAIDSVLNQTYRNIEVIIVDDNAPESLYRKETEIFMQDYEKENRIIYVKNPSNLGGALARNEGIFKAKGDYVTFLDDDDIYLPEKIETQIDFMIKNSFDMTFTDLRFHNSDDNLIDYRHFKLLKDFNKENLLKFHLMRHITGTPTFMYKKSALQMIGGFIDSKMGQEFYLMFNTITNDLKIGYLPQAHLVAYIHEGEKISRGPNKIEGEKKLFEFKKKYFDLLTTRERNFVKFRHHVVLAVAGLRNKEYFLLFKHAYLALIISPLDAIIEPIEHFKRIITNKKNTQIS